MIYKAFRVVLIFMLASFTTIIINAHWRGSADAVNHTQNYVIQIGSFPYIQPYNPNTTYNVGDMFTQDGKVWVVKDTIFNFLKPIFLDFNSNIRQGFLNLSINGLNEVSTEWKPHNLYEKKDIVFYNGVRYRAVRRNKGRVPDISNSYWTKLNN